ncbi:PREDICTED: pentatricopeptide repeat-containing protein At1g08610-like [Camelina sativa]|uniref:Pentatricopeptide repeat-containing protein At1g08610-like n=1 Tax=Camelina sativa TaxID=90675 RepID=A0ABM1R7V2_CAMSA|nr:PREDICTED: pentatricopeptide repeat-containing protein At1g08610-like [Camelina sativa]
MASSNSLLEVHFLHMPSLSPKQTSLCLLNPLSCRKMSSLDWKQEIVLKKDVYMMRCQGVLNGVCIDHVNDVTERSSEFHHYGVGTNLRAREKPRKHLGSSSLSSDGPITENDQETNNEILHNLCSNGKLTDACKLVEVMARHNQVPHFPSCSNLVRGLARIDQLDKAMGILRIMVMSGGVPDTITYNMIIGNLCKKGHIRSALVLLEDMSLSGSPPDVITYNTVIRCMFDHGKAEQAIRFWKEQLRNGCPPYMITYTVLVELVCRYCGSARAMEVLEDMAVEGCYPDIVTYNSLVNYNCRRGNLEEVALVIQHILSHGLDLNTVTYNTLLHSLCSHEYWDEVEEILNIMYQTSYCPTVVTYNILINGLSKARLLSRAIDFFYQMLEQKCSPDIVTYNTVLGAMSKEGMIYGFCRANLVEDASQVLKETSNRGNGIRGSTYKLVIQGLCKNKEMEMAIEVVEIMLTSGCKPDETIYTSIVKGVEEMGMGSEADQLQKKLKQWKLSREV